MNDKHRIQICYEILQNASLEHLWLPENWYGVSERIWELTYPQQMALKTALAIWHGQMDPSVARVLGFA